MSSSAEDFALRNIAQDVTDNLGGVQALWYVLAADVLAWPGPETPLLIANDVQLRPGATWYQLLGRRYSMRYQQKQKNQGRHGTYFAQSVKGIVARHTEGLAAGLENLAGQKLVLLYRDHNGRVQLVGTPESPVIFADDYDSGANPDQFNGFDFTIAGNTVRRARPYLGTWVVSGRGLEYAIQLQGTAGGLVQIRDRAGKLMATVPAGRTVVLRSGFRVAYTII